MDPRSQVMGEGKLRIVGQRLVEQGKRFLAILVRVANPGPAEKIAGPDVKVVGLEVCRRRHLQARHFPWRKIGLQRPDNPLGQLASGWQKDRLVRDRKSRPKHEHRVRASISCAFTRTRFRRDAPCLPTHGQRQALADLAQVARAGSILLHRGPADDLQVRDPRQAGEMSSCTPSAKKVFSRSSLRFSKGSTAMLFSGARSDGSDACGRRILGPLDPRGSDIVGPGQDDRDGNPGRGQ